MLEERSSLEREVLVEACDWKVSVEERELLHDSTDIRLG